MGAIISPVLVNTSGLVISWKVRNVFHSLPRGCRRDISYCSFEVYGYGTDSSVYFFAFLFRLWLTITCLGPDFFFFPADFFASSSAASLAFRFRDFLGLTPSPPQAPHPGTDTLFSCSFRYSSFSVSYFSFWKSSSTSSKPPMATELWLSLSLFFDLLFTVIAFSIFITCSSLLFEFPLRFVLIIQGFNSMYSSSLSSPPFAPFSAFFSSKNSSSSAS
mmetsp:Transcript_31110/g.49958  ORF Transcript_31110/g.49958 Transcript_31110/m.49958 type:complete len:218 (-) Transcript_31110:3-656(-)